MIRTHIYLKEGGNVVLEQIARRTEKALSKSIDSFRQ